MNHQSEQATAGQQHRQLVMIELLLDPIVCSAFL